MSNSKDQNNHPTSQINSEGGAVISGNPTVGGDFIGRDQHNYTINLPKPDPTLATAPSPPPDFVGRAEELDELTQTLISGQSVAITALQGMGGIGKTALAQQLIAQLNQQKPALFGGGIFWASLENHGGNADPILREWAAHCGIQLPPELTPDELQGRVRGALAQRQQQEGRLLAVLDDVRPAWQATAHLLHQSLPAGTPLLITTRERHLADALTANKVISLDLLPTADSETLLQNIIQKPDLLQDTQQVEQLLELLGRLPLAIRLAATYIRNFSAKPGWTLDQFISQLQEQSLQLLDTQGAQRGLVATFAISYGALTTDQQRLFGLTSVYSPPLLTVENIAGLLEPDDELARTLESELNELVHLALLGWHEEVVGLYTLHPLLGEYAYERLRESVDDVRSVHARSAGFLQSKITDSEVDGSPDEMLGEVDQWERAEEWMIMGRRASSLAVSLDHLGYWSEIDHRLARAIDRLKGVEDSEAAKLQVDLMLNRGTIAYRQAQWEEAIRLYEQSLQIYEERDNIYGVATSWMNLGNVYKDKGEWNKAIKYYQISMKMYEELGDILGVGHITNNIGLIYKAKGEWDKAIELYEKSLQIYNQVGNTLLIANTTNNIGLIHQARGEWDEAIEFYQQSQQTFKQVGDIHGIASTWINLGSAYFYKEEQDKARYCYKKSLQMFEQVRDILGIAGAHSWLGHIYLSEKEWGKARTYYLQSLQTFEEVGDIHKMALTYGNLGNLYQAQGNSDQAVSYITRAFLHFDQLGAAETQQASDLLVQILGSTEAVNAYLAQVKDAER